MKHSYYVSVCYVSVIFQLDSNLLTPSELPETKAGINRTVRKSFK